MTWTLLMTFHVGILSSGGVSAIATDFASFQTCHAAAIAMKERMSASVSGTTVTWVCVRK
jgi:hypothetical protein